MKRIFLLLVCLALFSCYEQAAHACSCKLIWPKDVAQSEYPAIRKAFEQFSGAVFVGRVVKSEKIKVQLLSGSELMRKVTVKVEQRWVGAVSSEIVVYAGLGGCDKRHFKGQRYFFFAESRGRRLEVASCFPSSLDNEVINSLRLWFAEPKPT